MLLLLLLLLLLLVCLLLGNNVVMGSNVNIRNNNNDLKLKNITKKRSSDELVAYLHAGPGKTGTTHIQAIVIHIRGSLLKEKVAIWPNFEQSIIKCESEGYMSATGPGSNSKVKKLSFFFSHYDRCVYLREEFAAFVENAAKLHQNIFFSSEGMQRNHDSLRAVIGVLNSQGYVIHGVMTYRFQLNWIISFYHQQLRRQSILSKEADPSTQLLNATLSEYLNTKGPHLMGYSSIVSFHELLMEFPHSRFSVVDFYGVIASKKPLSFVFLCEIMGVVCQIRIHKELDGLKTNDSDEQDVIFEKQVAFAFMKFAAGRNCTLDFSQRNSPTRNYFINIAKKHDWGAKAPLHEVPVARYAHLSLDIDRNIREKFHENFINANGTANAVNVNPLPVVLEVDTDNIYANKTWIKEFTDVVRSVSTKRMCLRMSYDR